VARLCPPDGRRGHGQADYQRLTGDTRPSDLALWPQPGTDRPQLQSRPSKRWQPAAAPAGEDGGWQSAGSNSSRPNAIRERSLHIFDRSFAVTYWLQAVAIGIGLFGVAASFRRPGAGAAQGIRPARPPGPHAPPDSGRGGWRRRGVDGVGAAAGLLLGLAVSVVLVHVVNPQSFHWTMDLRVPLPRLLALCAAWCWRAR
jgi:putative ABC transport system permease protein